MSYAYRRVLTRPDKQDQLATRAWARYELGNTLAREEYLRISDTIDQRYGDGAVTLLPDSAVRTEFGQDLSSGWSA
jgi:hypothetical protein